MPPSPGRRGGQNRSRWSRCNVAVEHDRKNDAGEQSCKEHDDSTGYSNGEHFTSLARRKNYTSSRLGHAGPKQYVKEGTSTEKRDTSNTSSSDNGLELPGFYYDAEKKKYFRILPGHCNPKTAVTRDNVKAKAEEKKRLTDLKLEKSTSHRYLSTVKKKVKAQNIYEQICSYQIAKVSCHNLKSAGYNTIISKLTPYRRFKALPNQMLYHTVEQPLLMLPNATKNKFWSVWSTKDMIGNRLELFSVKQGPKIDSLVKVNINPVVGITLPGEKITDICWAPTNTSKNFILYTSRCALGTNPSLARLRDYESVDSTSVQYFDLGSKTAWSCAWDKTLQQFSVGSERCALLIDVRTRKLWEIFSNKSDVLTQIFCRENGNLLYSGTRSGAVYLHDLRASKKPTSLSLKHKSSISSLYLMKDDNYLIASDFKGVINRWDLRYQSVVQSYDGHINEYTKLPVYIDDSESVLYAVGQDGYTTFWNITDSKYIKRIPPPCPVSRQELPVVMYSTRLGDIPGNVGLIMGIQDEFHIYGIDNQIEG